MQEVHDKFEATLRTLQRLEGKKAKIKCVGIGGGGGNAINHMMEAGINDVDFIAVNTDAQDLRRNKAPYLLQVGNNLLKGLGVGGEPELGKKAAEESLAELEDLIIDTDLLFITAGMGGGTGTGVAPVLAKIAKEKYKDDSALIYYQGGKAGTLLHEDSKALLELLLHMLAKKGEAYTKRFIKKELLKGRIPYKKAALEKLIEKL